ncbi:MAG: PAS domain-containing sensor histidine kinase [Deltaproteobacteria bacterium]|nr:MAG: PAS domain-containing sensor histidine kinase [Deltaproteobacteria bacterium]
MEFSDDAIISGTLDGRIISWNKGAERIYGYTPEEIKGRSSSMLAPPGRSYEIPEILEKIGRGEHVDHYETTRLRKDGKQIHVSLSVSPIRDRAGNIIGASAIARDITDRWRAEEEIKDMNERLARLYEASEATNKELEAFVYSVSHDLRTPTVSIGGFSRLLLEEYSSRLDEKGQNYLKTIYAGAERSVQLMDGLLALSRARHQELNLSEINMEELAEEVLRDLRSACGERIIRWDVKPLPPARGDRTMIRQVLVNLLTNAVKFTRPRESAVIEIGARPDDRQNVYCVKDNGVGFDMAEANKLFEVFKRLHPSPGFEGSGVGLAIVKRIVERHGGRVWADGEIDKGATFCFSLPK